MIQSTIAKPRRASDETVKMEWRVGDGGHGPPGEHLHSHPGLAQGYRPTRRWRRFYRIRLSFDPRRAGAQPGVTRFKFTPLAGSVDIRSTFAFRPRRR